MTRSTRFRLAIWAGSFGAGLVLAFFILREPVDVLTRGALSAAQEKWEQSHVTDYDLRYRMHGSEYEIKVRDGVVVEARVNDRPPTSADWQVYSMDGLFETLGQELDNLENPTGPFAGRGGAVLLRVRFHPEFGYVERFLRSGTGPARSVAIEMLQFAKLR